LHPAAAQVLGDRVLRPFLQDTIRFWPLSAAMAGTLLAAPLTIARVLPQARFFSLPPQFCPAFRMVLDDPRVLVGRGHLGKIFWAFWWCHMQL
jgi:hypothetical protein